SQDQPIPLSNLVHIRPGVMAAEVTHSNLAPTIDVTMNVHGRDLGHVSADVIAALNEFGAAEGKSAWRPYDPGRDDGTTLEGTRMVLRGEYEHMENTFV